MIYDEEEGKAGGVVVSQGRHVAKELFHLQLPDIFTITLLVTPERPFHTTRAEAIRDALMMAPA